MKNGSPLLMNFRFTEVEEDWGVRWSRSWGDYAAKALLPYKAFIQEIINAQRQIDGKEAQEYLKENAWGRCIDKYSKHRLSDNRITKEEVEKVKISFPWGKSTSNILFMALINSCTIIVKKYWRALWQLVARQVCTTS